MSADRRQEQHRTDAPGKRQGHASGMNSTSSPGDAAGAWTGRRMRALAVRNGDRSEES